MSLFPGLITDIDGLIFPLITELSDILNCNRVNRLWKSKVNYYVKSVYIPKKYIIRPGKVLPSYRMKKEDLVVQCITKVMRLLYYPTRNSCLTLSFKYHYDDFSIRQMTIGGTKVTFLDSNNIIPMIVIQNISQFIPITEIIVNPLTLNYYRPDEVFYGENLQKAIILDDPSTVVFGIGLERIILFCSRHTKLEELSRTNMRCLLDPRGPSIIYQNAPIIHRPFRLNYPMHIINIPSVLKHFPLLQECILIFPVKSEDFHVYHETLQDLLSRDIRVAVHYYEESIDMKRCLYPTVNFVHRPDWKPN